MLSSRTKAHFLGVALFLQMSGFECLQPSVCSSVSSGSKGLRWSSLFLGNSFIRIRSKQRQPSIHVLVSCACRLQGTGDSLLAYGDDQHKASGRKLKRLARRCFDEITSGHILSQYSSASPADLGA